MNRSLGHFCISQAECLWKGHPNRMSAHIRFCLLVTSADKAVDVEAPAEVDIGGQEGEEGPAYVEGL